MGFINISAYASSKAAIETLAKCLNLEYKEYNITFHLFHPPLTDTDSASGLLIPKEFKANAEKVGRGLAKNVEKKSFVICHSGAQAIQTGLMYLLPKTLGRLMTKAAMRAKK